MQPQAKDAQECQQLPRAQSLQKGPPADTLMLGFQPPGL